MFQRGEGLSGWEAPCEQLAGLFEEYPISGIATFSDALVWSALDALVPQGWLVCDAGESVGVIILWEWRGVGAASQTTWGTEVLLGWTNRSG